MLTVKMNLDEFEKQLNLIDEDWGFAVVHKDLRLAEYQKYLADPSSYEFPSLPGNTNTLLQMSLRFFAVISVVAALVLCFFWPSMLSITFLAAAVLQALLLLSVAAILGYLRRINAKLKRNF